MKLRHLTDIVLLICCVLLVAPARSVGQQPALMTGLGDHHHHPVTTSVPEAQAYFDQGLRLIYGFNHDEAARAFRRAAELDPQMPMAYWGIAKAVGPNYNLPVDQERVLVAHESVQRALELSAHATKHEQHYIRALAKLYTDEPDPDYSALAVAYRDAMKDLAERYPDDLDAATLYAESIMNLNPWRLWGRDGTPWEGTPEAVRVLESVMQRDPDHIGANHLYIHAVEASPQPERAMAAAMRLADLAPSAGHLVHMPGHIYLRTGDYTAARETNERAARADEAFIEATQATGIYPMMYYSHNLHFIAVAASGEGRFEEAQRAADRLARHVAPHLDEMPPLESFTLVPTIVLLRFERWDDVLKLPAPDTGLRTTTTMWHYAQGMALANTGRPDEAERRFELVRAAAEATSPDEIWAMPFNNRTRDILTIATHVLRGSIDDARGRRDAAAAAFERAVAVQDNLHYGEPPDWYFPVREALGATLLAAGRLDEAEEVFRADLRQHPRNARSLHGLATTLRHQDRARDAELVQQRLETAWSTADTSLDPLEVGAHDVAHD